MSGFTPPPGNNYPSHPNINGPGGAASDAGIPIHHHQQQHHGLPVSPVPQQYSFSDSSQHHQQHHQHQQHPVQLQYSNNNGLANGHAEERQQSVPAQAGSSGSGGEGTKGNRLRKACDSCSIRKVKVCAPRDQSGGSKC